MSTTTITDNTHATTALKAADVAELARTQRIRALLTSIAALDGARPAM